MKKINLAPMLVLIIIWAATASMASAQEMSPNPARQSLSPLAESLTMIAGSLESFKSADPRLAQFAETVRTVAASLESLASASADRRDPNLDARPAERVGFDLPGPIDFAVASECCASCDGGGEVCCSGPSCSATDGVGCESDTTIGACKPSV
jgi:hypothetical protein